MVAKKSSKTSENDDQNEYFSKSRHFCRHFNLIQATNSGPLNKRMSVELLVYLFITNIWIVS